MRVLADRRQAAIDSVAVAGLTLVAAAPLLQLDITLQHVFGGAVLHIAEQLVPFLVLLPLPMAYIAVISRERFQPAALGSVTALVLVPQGLLLAAVGAGMVVGAILVSYKARSVFHGDNQGWTYFRATSVALFALAITVSAGTAQFYTTEDDFRNNVQGNITDVAVTFAVEQAAGMNPQQSAVPEDEMTAMAGMLASNISAATIDVTERIVVRHAQESGVFTQQHYDVMDQGFGTADDRVPPEMRTQAENQIQQQLDAGDSEMAEQDVADVVRPEVQDVVTDLSAPSDATRLMIFLSMFSTVLFFKLPAGFLGGIYGLILERVVGLFRRESGADAEDDG